MFRVFALMIVTLVVGAAVAVCPAADAPQKAAPGGAPVVRIGAAMIPAVPGYYSLRQKDVQEELELLDEQIKKLEAIGKEYQESIGASYQQNWAEIRKLPAEEQRKKYAEISKKRADQMKAVGKKIEAVLLPHQIDLLKQINLRTRGGAMLRNPRTLEKLGLDEKQQEKLRKIREKNQQETQKLYQQIQKLQKELSAQSLEVLTPKQRKQLQDLSTQPYQGVYTQPLKRGGQ
ncbi:MAG: hypothetical protein HQ567_32440 [Candidatus Nealsonbacteria bacterium]|nr:hypothetical protein [Candidatus Nealsonbacteria bacterium]